LKWYQKVLSGGSLCRHILKWYQKVLSGGSLRLHVSKSRCVHKISM
jgi:hypothetical protein